MVGKAWWEELEEAEGEQEEMGLCYAISRPAPDDAGLYLGKVSQ